MEEQIVIEDINEDQPNNEQIELISSNCSKKSSEQNISDHSKSTGPSDCVVLTPEDGDFKYFKSKSALQKVNKHIRTALVLSIALFIGNYLYIRSDTNCPYKDDVDKCVQEFILPSAVTWVVQVLISAIIFSSILFAGLTCKISPVYLLCTSINIIYLCFYYHPILNKQEYGQLFALFFGIFIFIILVVCFILKSIAYCLRKRKAITMITLPAFVLLCVFTFYFTRIHNNCGNWNKGLGNESIQNDPQTCQVAQPDVCIFDVTRGWFDLSRFQSCSSCKVDSNVMEKYYGNEARYVGFPRTERLTEDQRYNIQDSILSNLASFNSLDAPEAKNHEIYLDKNSKSKPELKIQVRRNEELVKQRSKIQGNGISKNVVVIYIDALSRAGSHRYLKNTMKWFDTYNKKGSNRDTFQFFKYHSITPYTTYNLWESLYGAQYTRVKDVKKQEKLQSYLKTYKKNGYITGHSSDFCQISPLDIYPFDKIADEAYDHEGLSFACDPHYNDPESPYSIFKGPYSAQRRCLYGKDVADHVLDYGNQFWRTYPQEKKILYLDFLDAHEGTGEVVKYMDDKLANFLQNLEKDNLLEDTTVMLYSDHGLHMRGLFYFLKYKVVDIEIGLPMLYMTMPKKVSAEYKDSIKSNEQKLVYAHDIHNTLLSLADKSEAQTVQNSLLASLPSDRTCQDIGVKDQSCMCNYN